MKRFGILIFIAALVIGLAVASASSFGRFGGRLINFSMDFGGVRGSGNVVTETRDLSGFDSVEAGGVFQIEITSGKDFRVEVEADDNLLPLIRTEVDGDRLVISTEKRISSKNGLKVRVFMPVVNAIETSGAANVTAADLKGSSITLSASGASKIAAAGQADEITVELSGASKLNASELKVTNATIDSSGASSADVNVSGDLVSDLSGASRVAYSGSPANVKTHKTGASSVSAK